MRTSTTLRMALLAGAGALAMAGAARAADDAVFNIPAGELQAALDAYTAQSGEELIYRVDQLQGARTRGVAGRYDSGEALNLLLQDTGFQTRRDASGAAVVIRVATSGAGGSSANGTTRLAGDEEAGSKTDAGRDDDEDSSPARSPDDRIVVTGSRFTVPASQVAAPVIVIDGEALEATGELTLERALRQLPQNVFGASEFGAALGSSVNAAVNVAGGSTINLRGLGSESTLVLVDGRRIGKSGLFGGASDISGIPLSSIERVEVMLDGASSIYGSDAVGGVVNIILKKDYRGVEGAYTVGLPDDGGFEEHAVSASGGLSWRGGRLRASYEFLSNTDLDGSERPTTALGLFNPLANVTAAGATPLFYRYNGANLSPSELAGAGLTPFSPGVVAVTAAQLPAGQDGIGLTADDFTVLENVLANNDRGRSLIPETTRHTVQAGIEQGVDILGRTVNLDADIFYSTKNTVAGAGAATFTLPVPNTNPFNPFESTSPFDDTLVSWLAPGLPGPRFDTDQDVLRWNAGFDTTFGDWTLTFAGGRSREELSSANLNTSVSGFGVDALLADGFNAFASDIAAANTPELLARLQNGPLHAGSTNTETTINANLQGPLFQTAGGATLLSIGAEWRKYELDTFSEVDIASAIATGNASTPVGAFSPASVATEQSSTFAELLVPIVGADNTAPLIQQLTLTGALRHDDYDTFGDATTWSAGIVWAPLDAVRLRANHSTSFVAPTPKEALIPTDMFSFFDTFGFAPPIPIVDASGLPTGAFDVQNVTITGGNPDLKPETAASTTVGLELTPAFIQGLQLSASWHETSYEDRIAGTPISLVGLFPPDLETYPELIHRDENGYLVRDIRATNIAAVEVEGIDYFLQLNRETPLGAFDLSANVAQTTSWRQVNRPGDAPIDLVGEADMFVFNVVPEFRYSANARWSVNGVTLSLDASTSSDTSTVAPLGFGETAYTQGGAVVSSVEEIRRTYQAAFLLDAALTYDLGEGALFGAPAWLDDTSLSFRVVNLLDDQPELSKTLAATGEAVTVATQADFNPNLADPRGRMFYLGVRREF